MKRLYYCETKEGMVDILIEDVVEKLDKSGFEAIEPLYTEREVNEILRFYQHEFERTHKIPRAEVRHMPEYSRPEESREEENDVLEFLKAIAGLFSDIKGE